MFKFRKHKTGVRLLMAFLALAFITTMFLPGMMTAKQPSGAWKLIAIDNAGSEVYIDKDVTTKAGDISKITARFVPKGTALENKKRFLQEKGLDGYEYDLQKWEINCKTNEARLIGLQHIGSMKGFSVRGMKISPGVLLQSAQWPTC